MLAFIKTAIAFILAFTQILSPIVASIASGGKGTYYREWNAEMQYSDTWVTELQKEPGKDFVILNITDVQLTDLESNGEYGDIAMKTIDKLVNDTQPDLITLTGDNAWGMVAYLQLIEKIDSYGIPWAPVMGNHDGQRLISEFWAGEQFIEADNCLFKFGPEGMGDGNYIINITQNGRVVETLFMLDTHSDAESGGYDHLWNNQIEWYKWAVKGIKEKAGYTVPSICFMHIPCYEYRTAWEEAKYNESTKEYDNVLYKFTSFGVNHEAVCSPNKNNGFFEVCRELGSTKNIVSGHDHINSSSILYKGIRLTYGLKTGAGCYWEKEMSGGTTLTIDGLGLVNTTHIYVNPDTLA